MFLSRLLQSSEEPSSQDMKSTDQQEQLSSRELHRIVCEENFHWSPFVYNSESKAYQTFLPLFRSKLEEVLERMRHCYTSHRRHYDVPDLKIETPVSNGQVQYHQVVVSLRIRHDTEINPVFHLTFYYSVFKMSTLENRQTKFADIPYSDVYLTIQKVFSQAGLCADCLDLTKPFTEDNTWKCMSCQYIPLLLPSTEERRCPICLDVIVRPLPLLQCGHFIHRLCMAQLLPEKWYHTGSDMSFEDYESLLEERRKHLRCPLCRKALTTQDLYQVFQEI